MSSDRCHRLPTPTPFVSVVIPTRNRAHLLAATLHSALDQTLREIEVLVVDNGSTDSTPEIVASFAERDPRVIALANLEPGPSRARNTGLAHARAEWVAFLDDDDLWVPAALASLLDHAATDADVVAGRALSFCSESGSVTPSEVLAEPTSFALRPWPPCPYQNAVSALDLLWRPRIPTDAAAFRTSVLRELGGFDDAFPVAEDYDLWLRVAWRQAVPVVDQEVVLCRRHQLQETSRQDALSRQTRLVVQRFLVTHREARRQFGWSRVRRRLAVLHREEAYEALLGGARRQAALSAWRSLCCWPAELKSLLYLGVSPAPALFRHISRRRHRGER
jgi:hypothetical protein